MTHSVHGGRSPPTPPPQCHMTFELRAAGESKKGQPGKGLESVTGEGAGKEGESSGQMSPSGLRDSGRGHVGFYLCELDAWEGSTAVQCQGSC